MNILKKQQITYFENLKHIFFLAFDWRIGKNPDRIDLLVVLEDHEVFGRIYLNSRCIFVSFKFCVIDFDIDALDTDFLVLHTY